MIRRAIERRSVATIATVSAANRPHAAAVLYRCVDDVLFVSTSRNSRKARNIAEHGIAAVTIAVRRLPIGPPASIQFRSAATILANDDPEIVRLARGGGSTRSRPTASWTLPTAASSVSRCRPGSSPTPWGCRCGGWRATHSMPPARST